MQTARIPLVGSYNSRTNAANVSTYDQRIIRFLPTRAVNPASNTASWYLERGLFTTSRAYTSSGKVNQYIYGSQGSSNVLFAYGDTALGNSTVVITNPSGSGTISNLTAGVISGYVVSITETLLSSILYFMIVSSDGTGWYLPSDSGSTLTYTADGNNSTTITDIKIAGVNSVAGLYVGQKLSAASNIVAGSRIVSINAGAFSAVLDTATTGGAFNDLSITKEPIAKITDADFPSVVGQFAELDGYVFVMTATGKIYNSDLNSVSSWGASSFISANMATDGGVSVAKHKNNIVGFGISSCEFFYNAGNPSGSPLSRSEQLFSKIGLNNFSTPKLTIAYGGDSMFWATQGPSLGFSRIYMMTGYTQKEITNDAICNVLGIPNYLSVININGQSFLYVRGTGTITGASSFLYSIDLDMWLESGLNSSIVGAASIPNGNSYIAYGDSYYTLSLNSVTGDDSSGTPIVNSSPQFQLSKLTHGTNKRKFVTEIRLVCDKQSVGTVTLEKSDDDYTTWQTLGTFDMTQMNPRVNRCGSYLGGRAYRLTQATGYSFRGEALEVDYEIAA